MIRIALTDIPSTKPRRRAETEATTAALNALEIGAVLGHRADGAPYIIGDEERGSACRIAARQQP